MRGVTLIVMSCFLASEAFLVSPRMAGFGGGAAKKAKSGGKKAAGKSAAPLSPKRQWERLREQRDAGCELTAVYARVRNKDEWYEVGDVTASKGTDIAAAIQVQKRLILEHAPRVHPVLLSQAKQLECGFGEPTAPLSKVEPAEAADAGFVGRADASGRYGKTQQEIDVLEPTSLRKATKSVVSAGGAAGDSKGRLS